MSATKTIQKTLGLRYEPIAFSTLERAQGWVGRATKPMWVVLGDDVTAWAVCPSDAARLERAGYEIA